MDLRTCEQVTMLGIVVSCGEFMWTCICSDMFCQLYMNTSALHFTVILISRLFLFEELPIIHFCYCSAIYVAVSLHSAEVKCFSSAGNIFSYKRTLPAVWRRRGVSKLQSLENNCLFQKPINYVILQSGRLWTKPVKQYTVQGTVYLVTNPYTSSPLWESDRYLASQEIYCMEYQRSLTY